ncbi:MAG: T9SS type A sorting domain-containing protein [Flavobacteriales bacterium]|nr:T9SS type A sorting domain-containing protein [Flavobacteriales bacterium]
MKQLIISLVILFKTATLCNAQFLVASELANLPEPVSNNAVVEGWANDTAYVYSFGGIDSTKLWSGIHLKSWRYNTITDVWDTIPSLPDTLGKIAMAASWVDSIIYIIGGYHVYANSNEASSAKVHRFDPKTNTYLPDGADIPVPIDDHVQAVWNDSLIYVITGWSNTGNVPNVQIYDPANDQWLAGTPVPNNNSYKAFGASGTIKGDTIYYHGGASNGFNFPGQSSLRMGIINPNDPTQITWSIHTGLNPQVSYRSVLLFDYYVNALYCLGGASKTYNYDGIAYNGSGGVNPRDSALLCDTSGTNSVYIYDNFFNITKLPMDLRGYGQLPYGELIIAGGMLDNQVVSNKTYVISFLYSGIEEQENALFTYFPNPASDQVTIQFKTSENRRIQFLDALGKELLQFTSSKTTEEINSSNYPKGLYFLRVTTEQGSSTQKIIIQ